jgi:hypothetical protein
MLTATRRPLPPAGAAGWHARRHLPFSAGVGELDVHLLVEGIHLAS